MSVLGHILVGPIVQVDLVHTMIERALECLAREVNASPAGDWMDQPLRLPNSLKLIRQGTGRFCIAVHSDQAHGLQIRRLNDSGHGSA